ncbi:MAG: type I pullulanase, partial [Bacteroidia bacterium]|nr:type I pullulanase [Bacteroidia bacterium]
TTDGPLLETPGIYATAVGVNGHRALVLDHAATNPEGWEQDEQVILSSPNDAVIYELHVRDITIHPNSGSSHPGKYLGLVEPGTRGPQDVFTAIDHIKELGITHVHLLPSYDHYSIDETRLDSAQFNWGYDPQNYNVPEGSYSSDPYNAEVRVKEFKQMVKAFHNAGIGVILDVVYNHTGKTEEANFNQEVPGYYYRHNDDGSWSDASACGNETASERPMMRKFMRESVDYWAREYHLDGFRFDLMGIHDIETMNLITDDLKKLNPNIFVYGEGWTGGDSPLPYDQRALKAHTQQTPQLSAFSDDIRDGLKGSVFDEHDTGFVTGKLGMEYSILFGVIGSIYHDQMNYGEVNYSDEPWADEPWQSVSYVSCHDNHTLFDKLKISRPDASDEEINKMHKLANAIVLTTQGISFLHAGVEMMRTKGGEHNSYNKPDEVNRIDWQWKVDHRDIFEYYQNLIALRKNHPGFRLRTGDQVREHLRFLDPKPGLVGFQISGNPNGEPWNEIQVWYNANVESMSVELNDGDWNIAVLGDQVDESGILRTNGVVKIPKISMLVAYK